MCEGGADVVAEESDVERGEGWSVGFEFAQGCGEQAGGAEVVVAMKVVEGDGDLDEALEEDFFGLRGGEPDTLPGLVSLEELAGAVEAEAFCEGALGPVEGHGMSLSSGEDGGVMRLVWPWYSNRRVAGVTERTAGWSGRDYDHSLAGVLRVLMAAEPCGSARLPGAGERKWFRWLPVRPATEF